MLEAGPSEFSIDAASALPTLERSVASSAVSDRARAGIAVYRLLMGVGPAEAMIDDDSSFDRHVLASILAVASMEDSAIGERVGLTAEDIAGLMRDCFPNACAEGSMFADVAASKDDEVAMVRDLLLMNRSIETETSRWLASMIARRAMEPNHLWEDLGLRDRSELTRLLSRHFAPIAVRNTHNMRWKRFFYRALCESDGFVMCTTPVCTDCRDFDLCFGDESGESRMADRRREATLAILKVAVPLATSTD